MSRPIRGLIGTSPRRCMLNVSSAVAEAFMSGGADWSTAIVEEVDEAKRKVQPVNSRATMAVRLSMAASYFGFK